MITLLRPNSARAVHNPYCIGSGDVPRWKYSNCLINSWMGTVEKGRLSMIERSLVIMPYIVLYVAFVNQSSWTVKPRRHEDTKYIKNWLMSGEYVTICDNPPTFPMDRQVVTPPVSGPEPFLFPKICATVPARGDGSASKAIFKNQALLI